MAKQIFKNVHFTINTVDLSIYVRTITLEMGSEIQDSTAHGSNSRTRLIGLNDWSINVEFFQDYVAAKVEATMWAIHNGGIAVAMILRKDAGVKAETNPEYTGNVVMESAPPIGGSVGDVHMSNVVFRGDGDLGRAIT